MPEKKSRVSKSQWLETALEFLEKEGVNGVKIELLAKALGVAKTGFYWHFKDRRELLDAMLEHWEYEYTTTVVHYLDSKKDLAPEDVLLTIMQMVRENRLNRYDLAMRSWADTDDMARDYVLRTYQIRFDTVKGIFRALGFTGQDLETRTRMFIVYESWNPFVFPQELVKKIIALEKQRLKFYTR